MKKIKVTLKNGTALAPAVMPSAEVREWVSDCVNSGSWGKPERWLPVQKDNDGVESVQGEDIALAIATRESEVNGEKIVEKKFLADYEIVEEDMTAELAAVEADKEEQLQVKSHFKGMKKSDLKTVSDCADAIMKILKHLRADK